MKKRTTRIAFQKKSKTILPGSQPPDNTCADRLKTTRSIDAFIDCFDIASFHNLLGYCATTLRYSALQVRLRLEGSPVVSVVGLDNVRQHGDGSGHRFRRQKSHDTNHGQSSIVDFRLQALGLLFGADVLGRSKGIKEIVWNRVGKLSLEGGEFSNLVRLVDPQEPLEESNESNDLCLRGKGEGVPLGRRGKVGSGHHVSLGGQGPWEDKVGLDAVSNKGGHGDTSVLDLGLSEESDGSFLVQSVKSGRSQVQGIPESNQGVELDRQGFEVGLEHVGSLLGGWERTSGQAR